MKALLLLSLALLLGCKKNEPAPVDQLPPATQTGANTFGCLVNGVPWTPQGFDGSSNYSVSYDQNLYGVIDLRTYRYQQQPTDNYQYIVIYASDLRGPKSYNLSSSVDTRVSLNDRLTGCYLNSRDAGTYHKGTLTITRLDLQAGIVSGTFAYTLAKPGCDTVRITQGRFDKKL
ncbi:hypothetical protein [Hymenobacter sp. PAMC 26628]|uniref:hypothetical protein n=1 Tax=Hymenobacter sp. PAMC 26628 TaxID=1484118 RepID=UPI0007704398|nr:hypothetical protein [Hymenobacter sp. PAMC 26628]AMJ67044.1 hypothetical protein AXW84_17615 [Hymenobacter sp. PAMC 26628]